MFTEVAYATSAGSGRGNEDLVIAGPAWIVVLDGATAAAGVDSGCAHDVSWLVARLGGALAARLSTGRDDDPLADVLESAVEEVAEAHGGACDLGNPDSPSSTVAMVRTDGGRVDYLVLGDSPVVCSLPDGGVLTVVDDRLERLPGGRPYSLELVRRMRNAPGGFWVAGARPEAARESVCGTVAADGVAVLTDGVARLVDWYGWSWAEFLAALAARGPAALIAAVRELESARGPVWGKAHDDATVAWARPASS
ncbi:protein phosphatase 2C domain-containing protein [Nonomuraea sp. KC401]|uniref:Protein phosphatase 2C domain-containing protein n=1 Tax=Nonomuraea longispora TaxID=1848320 RepID=A0A4R4MP76_9ACTN|nr:MULTISPECIES: protein phosphatase 2C domain-containing protein [Nonomuraea]NBE96044.1 protein phosphatase 2C domain-containing protein [Nonomuraea sp. K271]TDB97798.1 protein phosphatase 2C domain-containing protein [Nonomuraea longispora]TLF54565.1 protein phosphatase 2C domain-containing protein [Nonomuraea sp. KC401]